MCSLINCHYIVYYNPVSVSKDLPLSLFITHIKSIYISRLGVIRTILCFIEGRLNPYPRPFSNNWDSISSPCSKRGLIPNYLNSNPINFDNLNSNPITFDNLNYNHITFDNINSNPITFDNLNSNPITFEKVKLKTASGSTHTPG